MRRARIGGHRLLAVHHLIDLLPVGKVFRNLPRAHAERAEGLQARVRARCRRSSLDAVAGRSTGRRRSPSPVAYRPAAARRSGDSARAARASDRPGWGQLSSLSFFLASNCGTAHARLNTGKSMPNFVRPRRMRTPRDRRHSSPLLSTRTARKRLLPGLPKALKSSQKSEARGQARSQKLAARSWEQN